jgi:hypothetical protein
MGMDGKRSKAIGTRLPRAVGGTALLAMVVGLIAAAPAAVAAPGANCRPYASNPCLLPFPNNLYTVKDQSSVTGRRVHLPQAAMPTNTEGSQIKVKPYNRNDGFSPGSDIVARVPGLDNPTALENTNPVPLTDMSKTFKPSAPIVVIDAQTHNRQLIWAEIDSNAPNAANTTLLIHPGKNLVEGRRYIVALRNLKNRNGNTLQAPGWFKNFRDGGPLPPAQQSQKRRYARIFESLGQAGIQRGNLYMAWDFTVMSRRSLSSRMLHIRERAFGQLGDWNLADQTVAGHAPDFQVTGQQDFTPAEDPRVMRIVTGTFQVPCYLTTNNCAIGGGFHYSSPGPEAPPTQKPGNMATAPFECIIPQAAASDPARASLYGHGLLGDADEVEAGNVKDMASEHDMMFCATDWWGLSSSDVSYDITALQDLNKFPQVVDRLQQGVLNTLYLGRLMRTTDGFASHAAFQDGGSAPLFDISRLYYDGNSQGGIMGGMTTALAPDYTRAVLGVPGMDYGGLLLTRSSDFPLYAMFLFGNNPGGGYTDTSLHPLILDLMQQLWDRGEADGYAQHMTTHPLPETPIHKVLMHVAYGDFQVSQYSAAVEARTIGAKFHSPALDLPARSQDANLFYGISPIPSYPFSGSAIVIWDSGPGLVSPPPVTNTAPSGPQDPHSHPRNTVAARAQKSAFLMPNGAVTDVCGGQPCHTDAFTP